MTNNHMRSFRFGFGLVCFMVMIAIAGVIGAGWGLPRFQLTAQSSSQQQIYVPLVMANTAADAATDRPIETPITVIDQGGEEQSSDEWVAYESQTGGYTFMYPAIYTVTEYDQGFVQLHQTGEDSVNGVLTLMYLYYEISPTDDPLEWAKLYDTYKKEGAFELDFFPSNLDDSNFGAGARQLDVESTASSPLPLQAFLITNGRLVLRVSTHTPAESEGPPLQEIAQSVKFSATAPQDLAQLFAPEPAPGFTTFQEYVEYEEEGELVTQALDIRMFTGETPTDLLEQMSERGRHRYEVALEAQADVVQELDRQRAEPTPSGPEYSESDYQSYLESEAEYNQTLPDTPPGDEPSGPSNESGLSPAVHIVYTLGQPDKGIAFIIGLDWPLEASGEIQQACQRAAEAVLDTVVVLD